MQRILTSAIFILITISVNAFELKSGQRVTIACDTSAVEPVVKSALKMLSDDIYHVLSADIVIGTKGSIIVKEDARALDNRKEAFRLKVSNRHIYIIGSDAHGIAYGLLEISRLMGVSPWEWWADVTPEKKSSFSLPDGYHQEQSHSVEYRGIFINDEDWGLMPWSSLNYEPWYKSGRIGPKTNARIFELLLRLRANTFWPAMHECTQPFFLTPGNREEAELYGIYIGGSHCEPMASSTAGEWSRRGNGDYDYVNNRDNVYRFWEERVKVVAHQPILFTIGMRGVHDGAMNGAKTVNEQKKVLEQVFDDQRNILRQYVNTDITKVPQVFIPYKEVFDIYNAGLRVPDDVSLMWCDDNYGYIRHFPTDKERTRQGGNGIYYHVSYWGRPHDYLWLGTFSPALLYQQMTEAYDHGIQKIWILNVGDIKPSEYQIELFLDMAWNIKTVRHLGVIKHLQNYLCREMGEQVGRELLPIMTESYRLAFIHKPEFMGNTREEEYQTNNFRIVRDLPWSLSTINKRLLAYQKIEDHVEDIFKRIPSYRRDAYFQLIKYPVQAAAEMNKKFLYAQQARHGLCSWNKSADAYDSIVSLTRQYNVGFTNRGKWMRMMDFQPRQLPVFQPILPDTAVDNWISEPQIIAQWNGTDARGYFSPCEGLGYEGKAVKLIKDKYITFCFDDEKDDSVMIDVMLLPSHPINSDSLRFSMTLDKIVAHVTDYATHGQSEEWKLNVLSNHAIRRFCFPITKHRNHLLTIKPLDDGLILDQVRVIRPH